MLFVLHCCFFQTLCLGTRSHFFCLLIILFIIAYNRFVITALCNAALKPFREICQTSRGTSVVQKLFLKQIALWCQKLRHSTNLRYHTLPLHFFMWFLCTSLELLFLCSWVIFWILLELCSVYFWSCGGLALHGSHFFCIFSTHDCHYLCIVYY